MKIGIYWLFAEHCGAQFFMGWHLYLVPIIDGKPRAREYRWCRSGVGESYWKLFDWTPPELPEWQAHYPSGSEAQRWLSNQFLEWFLKNYPHGAPVEFYENEQGFRHIRQPENLNPENKLMEGRRLWKCDEEGLPLTDA